MEPHERIYKELLHEKAAIWYINDEFGAKVMVKTTSASIRAIMTGCRIEFLFGKDTRRQPPVFHKGLRIHDDPVHYLNLTGTDRFPDEHSALDAIMGRSETFVHFHNELNACQAVAELRFSVRDQLAVKNLHGDPAKLYCGDFDDKLIASLDCFDFSLGMRPDEPGKYNIETLVIRGELSEWTIMKNTFITDAGTNTIMADEPAEGDVFEREVWLGLTDLFGKNLYWKPEVPDGRLRELIDVLAFSSRSLFLIEAKATGVFAAVPGRTMGRKVKGLQKQVSKAIGQLAGALKSVKARKPIISRQGDEIIFNRDTNMPHCIVLVSELLPFGDWQPIVMEIFQAMIDNACYVNVMDLREFMQYIGVANGNPEQLNLMMIERVEDLVRHQNIHMVSQIIPPGESKSRQ